VSVVDTPTCKATDALALESSSKAGEVRGVRPHVEQRSITVFFDPPAANGVRLRSRAQVRLYVPNGPSYSLLVLASGHADEHAEVELALPALVRGLHQGPLALPRRVGALWTASGQVRRVEVDKDLLDVAVDAIRVAVDRLAA
jgi:hypothetical protein